MDVKFSAYDAFLEKTGRLKIERLESQIILKYLRAIKPKDLNVIAKIVYGHLCLREDNLCFDKNYIFRNCKFQ